MRLAIKILLIYIVKLRDNLFFMAIFIRMH